MSREFIKTCEQPEHNLNGVVICLTINTLKYDA